MKQIIIILFLLVSSLSLAQTGGCTDPSANNYNAAATFNNGSCTYNASSAILTKLSDLPTTLNEVSGLIYYNGKLYGHQDSGGPAIVYEIDPTSYAITKTITLQGATNVDWEDITQSETHIFVGDIGNNVNGNRQNLKIYKFPKSAITAGTAITIPSSQIEVINYSYEDQTNFAPTGANKTAFDCEALAYNRGKLHLFTKNWIGSTTSHYVLPTTAGTYVAKKKETYDTGTYKITGAEFGADNLLALVAYEVTGIANVGLFLAYGFDDTYQYLNSGSTRLFSLGSAISNGQVEAIAFKNPLEIYVGNEKFSRTVPFFGTITVNQALYSHSILNYIKPYYEKNQVQYNINAVDSKPGTMRYNDKLDQFQGYDGTHWEKLGKY